MKQQILSPLSLIAVFAGIIEASALASLPFLNESSQSIYTWFLVGFPFFLTVLFFLTLNFNAPSLFMQEKPELALEPAPLPRAPPEPAAMYGALACGLPEAPSATSGPIIIALSGPQSRKTIEQHILATLETPQSPTTRSWVFYDLDARRCIRLSVGPMEDDPDTPFPPS